MKPIIIHEFMSLKDIRLFCNVDHQTAHLILQNIKAKMPPDKIDYWPKKVHIDDLLKEIGISQRALQRRIKLGVVVFEN